MVNYDRKILPGEEGKILVEIDTKGYSGKISKTVTVETNDQNKTKFDLRISANIKRIFKISPFKRAVISTPVGKPSKRIFNLINQTGHPVKVVKVIQNIGDSITLDFKIKEEGQSYQLTVSTLATKKTRRAGYITLMLEDSISKEFKIHTMVHIWPPKDEEPDKLAQPNS